MALARENPEEFERLMHLGEEEWWKEEDIDPQLLWERKMEEEARRRGEELASSPRGGTVASLRSRIMRKLQMNSVLFRLRIRRLLHSVPWPAFLEGLGLLFGDLQSWEEARRAYRRWKRARRESWKRSIQKLRRLPPRRDSYEQWKREVGLSENDRGS